MTEQYAEQGAEGVRGRGERLIMSTSDESPRSFAPSDVRHRLANVFQLLSTLTRMRIQRTQDAEARRLLSWTLDAVGALGAVQQRMLDPAGGDFSVFLADMLPVWRRRCAGRPVRMELVADPLPLREPVASALAIIVNELVSNALSHAHPDGRAGAVRVALETLPGGRAALSVVDDGVGCPTLGGEDRSKLGLWLVRGLTDQVKGVMTITSADGVNARLEFPAGL